MINTEVDMFGTSEGRRIGTQKDQVQTVLHQMTTFCDATVRREAGPGPGARVEVGAEVEAGVVEVEA